MSEKEHRPPLTEEEKAEKRRLRAAYIKAKAEWRDRGETLTDQRLGLLVAEFLGRDEPYTQGSVWQFTSEKSNTRIPVEFAQGVAGVLGFPVGTISPRFVPKPNPYQDSASPVDQYDPDTAAVLKLMSESSPGKRSAYRKALQILAGVQDDPGDQ